MSRMTPEPAIHVYRPDRPGIRKVLGDLEAEIMEVIWARPPDQGTTVRDVFEVLYARRRLARKNLLHAEKVDQAYVYYPNFTEEEFISRFVGRILENLLVSFSGATLAHLDALAEPQAAARARELLEEIARRRAAEERP